jgi:putative nucleotidyltransferase with HDIG domain
LISPSLLNARILIVDDQEPNIILLKNMLEDEDYTNLKSTTDSREVVALVKEFEPDLILLDLMMPHLDGYAVMDQLHKELPKNSYLPILVLSADITAQAKQRALSLGAKDFLAKPFNQVEVMLRIENLLKTRALHLQQQKQNQVLEKKVRERTTNIQHQLERLSALHIINTAISGSLDIHLTLNIALEQIAKQLGVDAADVLLLNPYNQTLEYAAGCGFRTKDIEHSFVRLGEGFTGRAILDHETVRIPDLQLEIKDFKRADLLSDEGFAAYIGVPLIVKGEVKGVLELFHRTPLKSGKEWLEFLETLVGQIAIAVDSAQMFTSLKRSNLDLLLAYDATIEGWSKALDLRDKETEGHTLRVTDMTLLLARHMGVNEAELVHIRRGALLHDIGKMGIPDEILLKPGPLTDEEWVIMHQHPRYAFDLLMPIEFLHPALDIPYCHHEKWDGSGYPRGLKGVQIPLDARIFAVVDVWDALRSDRPYRKAWPEEKVRNQIKSESGTHFDPEIVDLFMGLLLEKSEQLAGG